MHKLYCAQALAYHSEHLYHDPAWMWITQESHSPSFYKIKSSYLEVCLLPDGLLFSHLPEEYDSFSSILAKVICLDIEFAFICLSNNHWIHSGKWGVTTFKEVFKSQA